MSPPGQPVVVRLETTGGAVNSEHIKTHLEALLFNEIVSMNKNAATLKQQNDDLLKRIEALENVVQAQPGTSTAVDSLPESITMETNWIVQKSRAHKKRKAESSPEIQVSPQLKLTPNSKEQTKINKDVRPPPITVSSCNFEDLHKHLEEKGCEYKASLLNSGEMKLNAPNEEAYRKLVSAIKETELKWFTFEDKQNRLQKVIAKKLPASCATDSIVNDLRNKQNLKIVNVTNILGKRDRAPLPVFMLSFSKEESIEKIYAIETIMGVKVHIEPIKKSKLVPQCKVCQRFGHTQKYCSRDPRCVKCGLAHKTANCTLPKRVEQPKCCNCNERHPASYRGCCVAVEMQKIRDQSRKSKKPSRPIASQVKAHQSAPKPKLADDQLRKMVQPTLKQTFAQVASRGKQSSTNESQNQSDILKKLLDKMTSIDNQMKAVSSRVAKLETSRKQSGKSK